MTANDLVALAHGSGAASGAFAVVVVLAGVWILAIIVSLGRMRP